MKVLTEADLRTAKISLSGGEYHVSKDTFVTAPAREYLRDMGVCLVTEPNAENTISEGYGTMTCSPAAPKGNDTYMDAATGKGIREKPETMTHLRGNLLVPKTHPRIILRGKLDGLQARVLLMQKRCVKNDSLFGALGDVLDYLRAILGAEVKEEPLGEILLFGFTHKELRRNSHNVRGIFGMEHPVPDCRMGAMALELNLLRTQVREAELSAAMAFEENDFLGIIEHLNRLSSGIYILFCREVSGKEITGKDV